MKRCLTLAMLIASLLTFGCASREKEPPPTPFSVTRWTVVLELPLAGEQPSMRFGDGRVEGFGGCNKFQARYVQDSVGAHAIAIGRIEIDRRLCEAGPRSVEARMLEVLQSVSSYTITGDTMTMSGSGGSLTLRAPPQEVKK
jgi:heat shock protein HslJ